MQQLLTKPRPGAAEAYSCDIRGAVEDNRDLSRAKLLPRREPKDFAVGEAQSRKYVDNGVDCRRFMWDGLLALQTGDQSQAPPRRALLVRQRSMRDSEQPRQLRIPRDVVEPAPGDGEHVCDEIVGVGRRAPPARVSEQWRVAPRENTSEPVLPVLHDCSTLGVRRLVPGLQSEHAAQEPPSAKCAGSRRKR